MPILPKVLFDSSPSWTLWYDMSMSRLVSTNPAKNYAVVGELEISTEAEIKAAVENAKLAAQQWREIGVKGRSQFFEKFLAKLEANSTKLAELQTSETGKVLKESQDEVADAVGMLRWIVDNAEIYLRPEVLDESDGYITELHKEPYGVFAAITPWNFPTSNFMIAVAQVMICGNVVVFKHSEECPLTGKLLADLMGEAGFPKGTFTEVYGDGSVGATLTNQDVNFISFTGSTKVGKQLYKKAAEKFIKTRLELGGSSPGIIFDTADLDKAIPSYCEERFLACGQVCCALKRLIVQDSIFDAVVEKLKTTVNAMVLGDPTDAKTTIGPLVAKRQQDLLKDQLSDAVAKGAKVVVGGNIPDNLQGAYFEPTILTNVSQAMRVVTEEVFGPILPVYTFKTEEEAIQLANNTKYGLSAFVYSGNAEQALRVASRIEAGQLSVNGASYFSDHAPFGGYKESGLGRGDGKYGFYESTQAKVIARPK